MTSMGIIEYAAANDLDPADLVGSMNGDPDPEDAMGYGEGTIRTQDGDYLNAIYPIDYLDLHATNVRELRDAL